MFKRKTLIVVAAILILFFGGAFLLGKTYVVPILMYHSINPVSSPTMKALIVSPQTFDRQMHFLKAHNYNVIPLEKLVRMIGDKEKIPLRTVAITFDDGYIDNYAYALTVLKKYNLPATIFIIVGEVGRPQADRLNWKQIKEMQDSGIFTVGSHTLGAEPLINIRTPQELKRQIFGSKRAIEEKLHTKVTLFSYPEGFLNAGITRLVRQAGYIAAVAGNPGKEYPNDDLFILKRVRISENSRNMFIFAVESSGFYTFIKELKKDWKETRRSWAGQGKK